MIREVDIVMVCIVIIGFLFLGLVVGIAVKVTPNDIQKTMICSKGHEGSIAGVTSRDGNSAIQFTCDEYTPKN